MESLKTFTCLKSLSFPSHFNRVKSKKSFWITLLTFLVLSSCKTGQLKLVETNAKGEVPVLENLRFRFSAPMVPDSMVNRWLKDSYLTLKPAVAGQFRWENNETLLFSPAEPLKPATAYTVNFSGDLFRFSEESKLNESTPIAFETPRLQLEQGMSSWVIRGTNTAEPVLQLVFNFPVEAADLQKGLMIKSGNGSVGWHALTTGVSAQHEIALENIAFEDKDYDLEIVLEASLVPQFGTLPMKAPQVMQTLLPSPFRMEVLKVEGRHDGVVATIDIKTSQPVQPQNLNSFIITDPNLNWNMVLQEDGVVLTSSEVDVEKAYNLTIKKGLKGAIAGALKDDFEQEIGFGKLEPSLQFTNQKGMFLSKEGARNLEISAIQVPRFKLTISKIYENNLNAVQQYGYYPDDYEQEEYVGWDGHSGYQMGDVVFEKMIETSALTATNGGQLLSLNVADALSDLKGIYHVQIRSENDYWVSDSKLLSISDIGLVAREGAQEMFVFAQSIVSAQPLSGVQLAVYGRNNQIMGTGVTNEKGEAAIAFTRNSPKGFQPTLVVAKTPTDFNFLPLSKTRIELSRFETGGKPWHPSGLDAMLYAERDIYRPGDSVQLAAIVRDQKWGIPASLPLQFRVVMPNGKEWAVLQKNAGNTGFTNVSLGLPKAALTGTYQVELLTGKNIRLQHYSFRVEEFVPDRIKLTTQLQEKQLTPGMSTHLDIQGDFLYGTPAASSKWETSVQISPGSFSSKSFSPYDFSVQNIGAFFDETLLEGKLDENGKGQAVFQLTDQMKNKGVLQVAWYTTVFDESGRPVSRHHKQSFFTQPYYIGIAKNDDYYYPLQKTVAVPVVTVGVNGEAIGAQPVKMQVIKKEFKSVLSKAGGYFRYQQTREDKILKEFLKNSDANGKLNLSFVPTTPGQYEIRLFLPGSASYVAKSFYSYGSWGFGSGNFEVQTDGQVSISASKKTFKPGDQAEFLFKTPFNGKLLITVEQDKVVQSTYVDVQEKAASFSLPITEALLPGFFISATLIKPHAASDIPLTVAHGFQKVGVEDPDRRLPVKIIATEQSGSRTKQNIRVQTEPGADVTIAVVDEGILQVTDFKSPDPFLYFYEPKAMGLKPYDLYPFLFPETGRRSSTGGDGGLSLDKRINPFPASHIKLVRHWSGLRKANKEGWVETTVDIPAFSGSLRIMAVAAKQNKMGAGVKNMRVADPLVVNVSLPRVVSSSDSFRMKITVSNTSKTVQRPVLELKTSSGLKFQKLQQLAGEIRPGSSAVGEYMVSVGAVVGTGKWSYRLRANGVDIGEEQEVSIRPPAAFKTEESSGKFTNGSILNWNASAWVSAPQQATLWLGRTPLLQYGARLEELMRYPYGCTEQVVASTFLQLYESGLTKFKSGSAKQAVWVEEAMRVLKSRQIYNGALVLWNGWPQENWWVTAYAAHFLQEAKGAGFTVDQNFLDALYSYLLLRVQQRGFVQLLYPNNEKKQMVHPELSYSLWVLARAGKNVVSSLNYYSGHPEWFTLSGRSLLAAAYAQTGNRAKAAELVRTIGVGKEILPLPQGDAFVSPVREEALQLLSLLEVQPAHPKVKPLWQTLAGSLRTGQNRFNTQELSFSLLALNKYEQSSTKNIVLADQATVRANGKTVATFNGDLLRVDLSAYVGQKIDVDIPQKGASIFYSFHQAGIPANPQQEEEIDQQVRVRRQYYNRNGTMKSGFTFQKNELLVVGLTVENLSALPVYQMVLSELIPAGFEIENPRIKDMQSFSWRKESAMERVMDIRDDRLFYFFDLPASTSGGGKHTFYYTVRAVTSGSFVQPSVLLESMYIPSIRSSNGFGRVEIQE